MMNQVSQSTHTNHVKVNGYNSIAQAPTSSQMTSSLQQLIKIGSMNHNTDSPSTPQLDNSGFMFDPSNSAALYSGVSQMGNDDRFTQLLPQVNPMNATPICVSALSHGPPHVGHQQQSVHNGAPFSQRTGLTLQQQQQQQQQQQMHQQHQQQQQEQQQQQQQMHQQQQLQRQRQQQQHQIQIQLQQTHESNQATRIKNGRQQHPGQKGHTTLLELPNAPHHTGIQLNQVATVPKQKLSSKSIVSIRTGSISSPRTDIANPNLVNNELCVTRSNSGSSNTAGTGAQEPSLTYNRIANSSCSMITTKQMKERQQSSYSSACNATIKAQQRLGAKHGIQVLSEKTTGGRIDEDENDTTDEVKKSLVGGNVQKISQDVGLPRTDIGVKRKVDGTLCGVNGLMQDSNKDQSEPHHKYVPVIGGKAYTLTTPLPSMSPHAYLQKLLVSRGYSTKHYCSLEGGYYCRPTALQCASYGIRVVSAVRTSNVELIDALLSAGLSRNPCNKFGESILHMVCRRGEHGLLKVLLDHGSTIQVSDDFGRTPLHDACWTAKPCFKSVEMLLQRDLRLLHIVDCRGSPPLEYVKKESWSAWIDFFERNKEVFWPKRNLEEESEELPPELVNVPPHSRPVPDPSKCASLDVAALYANGKKEPELMQSMEC